VSAKPFARANILGVGVSAINMQMAVSRIEEWVARREANYVIAAPVNCIIECVRDENLRQIYNAAGMVTPDGMPLVWVSKLMGYAHVDRVYGPDLMLAICDHSRQAGFRHFLYGGWPADVVTDLTVNLKRKFPGIQIVGSYSPPFRALTLEEDAEVVAHINATRPDIVWIGLGSVKQDLWAASHVGKLFAPVLIAVGAAFDFHAGRKAQAPRWMMRAGLEWLFRFASEPRRLGLRYIRDNPIFVWKILLQMLGKTPPPL
jgi:N-acetylglucosaminyldiphosphoundecaprenol N-acetyl-beta-D-mannosaminyltransferase